MSNAKRCAQDLAGDDSGFRSRFLKRNSIRYQILFYSGVKGDISESESVIQQAKLRRKMLQKELSSKEPEAKKARTLNANLDKELAAKKAEFSKLKVG